MAPSPKKKPRVAEPAADSSRSDRSDTAEVANAASGAQGDAAIEATTPVVSQGDAAIETTAPVVSQDIKWSTTLLLEMQSVESQTSYIQQWTTATKSRVDTALMVSCRRTSRTCRFRFHHL